MPTTPRPDHPALSRLLDATTPEETAAAWAAFVAAYSRLLLHTTRAVAGDRDEAMDAYVHALDRLRADDCARLRTFRPDGSARFTTWLVVVVRRLALDHRRQRLGRPGRGDEDARARRRRLATLDADALDAEEVVPDAAPPADRVLVEQEVTAALGDAVAGLDARDRLLLALRFTDDLPASRIAAVMGFPSPFHVYRRLEQLTRTLRASLTRRGIDASG